MHSQNSNIGLDGRYHDNQDDQFKPNLSENFGMPQQQPSF